MDLEGFIRWGSGFGRLSSRGVCRVASGNYGLSTVS